MIEIDYQKLTVLLSPLLNKSGRGRLIGRAKLGRTTQLPYSKGQTPTLTKSEKTLFQQFPGPVYWRFVVSIKRDYWHPKLRLVTFERTIHNTRTAAKLMVSKLFR